MRRAILPVVAMSAIMLGGCDVYFSHHPGHDPATDAALPEPRDAGPTPPPPLDAPGLDAGMPVDAAPLGQVRTLAQGLLSPSKIVLDGDYVYWLNTATGNHGSVMRVAKAGGPPQVLASAQVFPVGLVVDAHEVYWTNAGIEAATGQVMRVAKTGGTPVVIAHNLNWPADLAADDDHLFWRDDRKGIQRIAKAGADAPDLLFPSATLSGAIAIDATRVYFDDVSRGAICAVPKAGGPLAFVASLPPWFISTLVVDGDDVYWHNGGVDSLWHARTTGDAAATAVLTGNFEMRDVAVRTGALFVAQMGEPFAPGAIHQLARGGGGDRLVTPTDVGFWGLAVDDQTIYWTNLSTGTLNAIDR